MQVLAIEETDPKPGKERFSDAAGDREEEGKSRRVRIAEDAETVHTAQVGRGMSGLQLSPSTRNLKALASRRVSKASHEDTRGNNARQGGVRYILRGRWQRVLSEARCKSGMFATVADFEGERCLNSPTPQPAGAGGADGAAAMNSSVERAEGREKEQRATMLGPR